MKTRWFTTKASNVAIFAMEKHHDGKKTDDGKKMLPDLRTSLEH